MFGCLELNYGHSTEFQLDRQYYCLDISNIDILIFSTRTKYSVVINSYQPFDRKKCGVTMSIFTFRHQRTDVLHGVITNAFWYKQHYRLSLKTGDK